MTSNIAHFVRELSPGHRYTVNSFITQHTLLPYYALFTEPSVITQLQDDIHAGVTVNMLMRVGRTASRIPFPPFLKLCPACIEHDRQQYGFCYWHRKHQPYEVTVCATHSIPLMQTDVPTSNRVVRERFIAAEQVVQNLSYQIPATPGPVPEVLLASAHFVEWALAQQCWAPGLDFIHERYIALLDQRGLVTCQGRVRLEQLQQLVQATYSKDVLRQLHCEFSESSTSTWLMQLVRKRSKSSHPLHNFLLMHLLGYSAEQFFSLAVEEVKKKTFGSGPWPCLNPVCHSYQLSVIPSCAIRSDKYAKVPPIGTFACPQCEFTYERTWSATGGNPFERQHIVQVGPVWKAWLRDQWMEKTYSLSAIARQLNISSRNVARYAVRLGLPFPRPGSTASAPQLRAPSHDAQKEAYRQIWLQALRDYPHASRRMITDIVGGKVAVWLYRHDRDWQDDHLPKYRPTGTLNNRVDWEERDKQLSVQVYAGANALRSMPGRPKRITVEAIERYLGHPALRHQLDKLPLTRRALDEVVETVVSAAVRRIHYVAASARQENIAMTKSQLVRASGVNFQREEPFVQEAIAQAMMVCGRNVG